jgi:hypothetical protein
VTLWVVVNHNLGGDAILTVPANATNRGILHLETTFQHFGGDGSYLRIAEGARLTNETGGLIRVAQGQNDGRWIVGHLLNRGRLEVGSGITADFVGLLETDGGSYAGDLFVSNSQLRFLSAPSSPSTLRLVEVPTSCSATIRGMTLWIAATTIAARLGADQ